MSGGLAVDCIRQGHYDYLQRLLEGTTDIMEEEIVEWIVESGGWVRNFTFVRFFFKLRCCLILNGIKSYLK